MQLMGAVRMRSKTVESASEIPTMNAMYSLHTLKERFRLQ